MPASVYKNALPVLPAHAGIQEIATRGVILIWVPAFAGKTADKATLTRLFSTFDLDATRHPVARKPSNKSRHSNLLHRLATQSGERCGLRTIRHEPKTRIHDAGAYCNRALTEFKTLWQNYMKYTQEYELLLDRLHEKIKNQAKES